MRKTDIKHGNVERPKNEFSSFKCQRMKKHSALWAGGELPPFLSSHKAVRIWVCVKCYLSKWLIYFFKKVLNRTFWIRLAMIPSHSDKSVTWQTDRALLLVFDHLIHTSWVLFISPYSPAHTHNRAINAGDEIWEHDECPFDSLDATEHFLCLATPCIILSFWA